MDNMWRCPDCETINTSNKCVVCGCSKPKNGIDSTNNKQQSLKQKYDQDSLKDVIEQEQKDDIKPEKEQVINRNNKAIILVIMGLCIAAAAIICFVIGGIVIDKNNNENSSENIPSLSAVNPNAFEWVITSHTENISETTLPITEESEDLRTLVPESETDDNRFETVKMPSLLGKDYTEAIRILDTMGLSYTVSYSEKKYIDIGENCVYSQKPASGSEVDRNSVVELGISSYKTTTTQKLVTEPIVASTSQSTTIFTTANTKPITEKYTKSSTVNSGGTTTPITYDSEKTTTTVEIKELYTVYFYVHEDVIPVYVVEGDDAVPPSVESSTEYRFIGWNGNYQNVTENREVFALFEIIEATTTTEVTTTMESTAAQVGYDGNVTLLLSFNQYSLDNLNVPIDGTTWEDYYWTSSNEYCVQIISGVLQTYYEGETTLTLTYINDPSIVATTKVRVVSKIN